ncbi:MAG: DUF1028 domain-containing protein [Planctomycetota bacterium]
MMKRTLLALLMIPLLSPRTDATWSIVMVDRRTREIAIGSVTCLTSFDLRAITPVVLVERGGATVQAAGDFDGTRRPIIRAGFAAGTAPAAMLTTLAGVPGHQQRQYGIVDVLGNALTFTGSQASAWAGGLTGVDGDIDYALQGNILAGPCVVPAMEAALLAGGDLPARLMAAMEAARATGGDGRCSCSPSAATACGCPPPSFAKSGHIGYLIVARAGDVDDPSCTAAGCADGDYLMSLNVPFQTAASPDPVLQLASLYASWRAERAGRPDAIRSSVSFTPSASDVTMTVSLFDIEGVAVLAPVVALTVEHAAGSAGLALIGTALEIGGGNYTVALSTGPFDATDRFRITADDGVRAIVLMPSSSYMHPSASGFADCNGNGAFDYLDIAAATSFDVDLDGVPDECRSFRRGDCNRDGQHDLADAVFDLSALFAGGAAPACLDACDTNDDGLRNLADAIYSLNALFALGSAPPRPFPTCGLDPTVDLLECVDAGSCP